MPNYANNNLTISGLKKDIVAMFNRATIIDNKYQLYSFIKKPKIFDIDTTNNLDCFLSYKKEEFAKEFSFFDDIDSMFEKIKPIYIKIYEDAKIIQKEGWGVIGWYDFNCCYLGTKWNADIISVEELHSFIDHLNDNDYCDIHCCFDTAWTPPVNWLEKVVKDNPNLLFDMWTDEESGYKYYYIGSNGELSDDLSYIEIEKITKDLNEINPILFAEQYKYNDDKTKCFVDNFEDICNSLITYGMWSKSCNIYDALNLFFLDTYLNELE